MVRGSEFQRRIDKGYEELRYWSLFEQGNTKLKGRRGELVGIKSDLLETTGYSCRSRSISSHLKLIRK